MKQSNLFTKTIKEVPKDEVSKNAQLLIRAGFVDKLMAGVYSYLPLGLRVLRKINNIIREEINAVGGQEVLMPALTPKENWLKTGRWDEIDVLFKLKGAGDKDFALGSTHEEVVTPLVKNFVKSYKDLPVAVYQIQDKFRNEVRAKSGLLRGREFSMKDLYSFHKDEKDLEDYYDKVKHAYFRIFERCGLKAYFVEASGGAFSKFSHEFQVFTEYGEDTIVVCGMCGTYQNDEIAEGELLNSEFINDKELVLEKVKADRANSVQASCELMKVKPEQILKNVVYMTTKGLLGVSIRGDLDVADFKLATYLDDFNVRVATEDELTNVGLVPGFISPINNNKIKFIADNSVKTVKNYVTGANEKSQDYINANLNRDFDFKEFADLSKIKEGFVCKKCKKKLKLIKAIEVGNIFKLKTKFTEAFKFDFNDEDGKKKKVVMGCYGIGPSRVLGTIAEIFNDEKGIIWPKEVAPFQVHLIQLGKNEETKQAAEKLYQDLLAKNVEVLFDDREISAGEKFAEADLIGLPVRLVVSDKTLGNKEVELKLRSEENLEMLDLDKLFAKLEEIL